MKQNIGGGNNSLRKVPPPEPRSLPVIPPLVSNSTPPSIETRPRQNSNTPEVRPRTNSSATPSSPSVQLNQSSPRKQIKSVTPQKTTPSTPTKPLSPLQTTLNSPLPSPPAITNQPPIG